MPNSKDINEAARLKTLATEAQGWATPDDEDVRRTFLRALITESKLSQRQCAEVLHVDERTFRRWCSDKAAPWAAVELLRRIIAEESTPRKAP